MSDEDEYVDMMAEEEQQATASSERRRRGPTMCTSMSEQTHQEIWFTEDGRAQGPKRQKYSNWCTSFVRQKASILVERWDHFEDAVKDEWWNMVKVKCLTTLCFIFTYV